MDIATGSGNTALSAARRACRVTGVDIVPALLERARDRAAAERFGTAVREVRFVERKAVMRHYSPESWVEFMKKYFGPTILAHEAAGERAPELTAAMIGLARKNNRCGDATLLMDAGYVEVIAAKA